jgi:hypothetical protein
MFICLQLILNEPLLTARYAKAAAFILYLFGFIFCLHA